MQHIAIDLGAKESQLCIRSEDGTILREGKHPTAKLKEVFEKEPKSRVVLETCAEAFRVADAALGSSHEVRVVPGTLVKTLGVGARRIKTDKRDARALSDVSCKIDLPSVHIPSARARERRSLCTMREAMVGARTELSNSVRGYLRTQLVRPGNCAPVGLPKQVRKLLAGRPEGMPEMLERLLLCLEALSTQIAEADAEMEALAKADPTCQLLRTVPGVGPVTSLRFTAAIDDPKRFASAHELEAYLGLTPGENSSSERQRRTSITKAGPPRVRWVLVQASWCLIRLRPEDPAVLWAKRIAERHGNQGNRTAVVAMARKLAGILFAMWRDNKAYDPKRAAAPIAKA